MNKAEDAIRYSWAVGSSLSIYSRSKDTWFQGEITKIYVDSTTNKEWLMVKYDGDKKKSIQRLCKDIKPLIINNTDDIDDEEEQEAKQMSSIPLQSNDPRLKTKLAVIGYMKRNFKDFAYIIPSEIIPIIILFAELPWNITWKITDSLIKECMELLSEEVDLDDYKPQRIIGPSLIMSFNGHKFKYEATLTKSWKLAEKDTFKIGINRYVSWDDNPPVQEHKELKFWLEQFRVYNNNKWQKIASIEPHSSNVGNFWLPLAHIDDIKNMKELIFNFEPLELYVCTDYPAGYERFLLSRLDGKVVGGQHYYKGDIAIKSRCKYTWDIDKFEVNLMSNTGDSKAYKFASKNFDLINENWFLCMKPRENGKCEIGLRLVKTPYNVHMIECDVILKVDDMEEIVFKARKFTVLRSKGWLWQNFGETDEFFDGKQDMRITIDIDIKKVWSGTDWFSDSDTDIARDEWYRYNVV